MSAMTLDDQIRILQDHSKHAAIEARPLDHSDIWRPIAKHYQFNFAQYEYRRALPVSQLWLVYDVFAKQYHDRVFANGALAAKECGFLNETGVTDKWIPVQVVPCPLD